MALLLTICHGPQCILAHALKSNSPFHDPFNPVAQCFSLFFPPALAYGQGVRRPQAHTVQRSRAQTTFDHTCWTMCKPVPLPTAPPTPSSFPGADLCGATQSTCDPSMPVTHKPNPSACPQHTPKVDPKPVYPPISSQSLLRPLTNDQCSHFEK